VRNELPDAAYFYSMVVLILMLLAGVVAAFKLLA
jgi:hypothetical protein